jgi:hypothetical protein
MSNKEIPMRGKSLNQEKLQVAGEFKRGDEHPDFDSLGYYKMDKKHSQQIWMTKERLEVYNKRKNKAARSKYKNDPEYAKRCIAEKCAHAKKHPEYSAKRASMRRAALRNGLKALTERQTQLVDQYYAYAARLTKKLNIRFHVDHTIPLSLGGKHTPDNLQVVPAKWNWSKNNRNTEKWQPSPI